MAGDDEDDGEMEALREALRQQSLAVEMLKAELEEERQAASSGADEALAMILRLQGEKAAVRMEADQFRRVAEERILHDEDSLAFLKAVVFSQEMDITSLKNRLLVVCGSNGPQAPAPGRDGVIDLPWLRRLAQKDVSSGRNASLPAARLEELCSDLDASEDVGDSRPARTVSDIGEVIRREKEWVRSNVSHHALPRLHRSSSHRLPRAPSYSAQCGIPNVHDKFEAPESVASHAPPRSSRRSSPEIISEEDDVISSSTRRGDCNDPKPSDERANGAIADLGAGIDEIKSSVQTLATELSRTRQTSMSRGDAQMQVLAEICAKLDAMRPMSKQQNAVHGGNKHSSREVGSSSKVVVAVPQGELLMDHFIEVCAMISSAVLARPLAKVAASMSLFRCFIIFVLAVFLLYKQRNPLW
ncbi:uncharacterized protein LOC123452360 isoform X1 [Hordeum vulgare subsp. vulgare]|uniref:uncharacterized protein LOC123452360 isoform X1 n=1 Tax=Hordeum vulgare subsp. vulgare TaxID=112509 RepID=UPI000296FBED|nr:uncharacterized protein LOC123452360 isoform X1 [Hordeum vulgare subsp. vulgare]XP_044984939.1 uncharacterized protein LOC123452360 isoform X1 [Hordeum vulgare subsp. vulgare]